MSDTNYDKYRESLFYAVDDIIREDYEVDLEKLIAEGADVNLQDKWGSTALIHAARKGYADVAEKLLARGAEVDVVGQYGRRALEVAVNHQHTEIVSLLLKHGANANLVRGKFHTLAPRSRP